MHPVYGSGGTVSATAQLSSRRVSNYETFGLVYAGVKFDGDGNLYVRQSNGSYGAAEAWLVSGSAGTFYLSRSIFSGTLNDDAGSGPMVMSSDRVYSIEQDFEGEAKITEIDFEISNDSSGSPIVASGRITLEAATGEPTTAPPPRYPWS